MKYSQWVNIEHPDPETELLLNCTNDKFNDYKNKQLFKEYLMKMVEQRVINKKSRIRQRKLDDLKIKLLGKDKFFSKNNFIENNINSMLKYFSSLKDADAQAMKMHQTIFRNEQFIQKREL